MRRKVVMLGEMAVGKTSIVRRLVHGRFEGDYKGTLGHDIYLYSLGELGPKHEQRLDLAIWDTDGGLGAGAFHFDAAVRGASAVMIVADATRPRTLETMLTLTKECEVRLPGRPIYLLFNKMDLLGDPADYALPDTLRTTPYAKLRTSAQSGDNVREAFIDAATTILRRGL